MRRPIALGQIAILVLFTHITCAQTTTETGTLFRWQFAVGQQYDVELDQRMHQQMLMPGHNVDVKNNVTTSLQWRVTDVDENQIATIEQVITRVQMTINSPMGGEMAYDSDSEEPPKDFQLQQLASTFKPMLNRPFTQKMNARGEILEVNIPDESTAGAEQAGGGGMSSEMIKDMTTKNAPVFPAEPMAIGNSWSKEGVTATPVGEVVVLNTYTYQGKAEDQPQLEAIDVDMTMEFRTGEDEAGQAKPAIDVVEQNNTGRLLFDAQNGRLVASELAQNMKVKVNMMGQKFDQNIESVTTMRVTAK